MTRTLADLRLGTVRWTSDETVAELAASRARVAASADDDRRRLQHDLHGGAQQRLAHAVLALRLARDTLAAGGRPADLIDEALAHAERASSELGGAVRGTLPTILVHGGLRAGVESVVADLGLAADVRVATPRLPAATETTAYLVVAEALSDFARPARPGRVGVCVELHGDVLVVDVRDDGTGGVDPAAGRGLSGLVDRVDAAGGTVTITSTPGTGTVVRAALPVEVA